MVLLKGGLLIILQAQTQKRARATLPIYMDTNCEHERLLFSIVLNKINKTVFFRLQYGFVETRCRRTLKNPTVQKKIATIDLFSIVYRDIVMLPPMFAVSHIEQYLRMIYSLHMLGILIDILFSNHFWGLLRLNWSRQWI